MFRLLENSPYEDLLLPGSLRGAFEVWLSHRMQLITARQVDRGQKLKKHLNTEVTVKLNRSSQQHTQRRHKCPFKIKPHVDIRL